MFAFIPKSFFVLDPKQPCLVHQPVLPSKSISLCCQVQIGFCCPHNNKKKKKDRKAHKAAPHSVNLPLPKIAQDRF